MIQEGCNHTETTRQGSNQFQDKETCVNCGKVTKLVRKTEEQKTKKGGKETSSSSTTAPTPASSTRGRPEMQFAQFQQFMKWQEEQNPGRRP